MFSFITDAVESVLDVGDSFLEGELPAKRQVAALISTGISIYAISEITGLAVDVIESMTESD